MNEHTIDSLEKYGHSFQAKVVSALLADGKLLDTLHEIIHPKFFESDANRWIVEETIEYYNTYKRTPTMDVFKVKTAKLDNSILKGNVIEGLREAYVNIGNVDLDYIKKEFTDFCRNQNLKQVILQSIDLLKAGNYNRIQELVDSAMKVGVESDLGEDYLESFNSRMEDENRDTVSTGWDVIDDLMDGGLGPGELGVIVSASGGGKTWCLVKLGTVAARNGLNVVHYTLELSQKYVGMRYDTVFSGIPSTELKERKDEVYHKVKGLSGSVLLKYLPPKSMTTKKLEMHVDKLIATGNRPDLIIIDYADLMLTNAGRIESTYAEQGGIYIDLRGLSGEYGIPIWTASQANRSAGSEDVIEADKVADSYAKVMNADFIMSLSRKSTDKLNDTARFHVMKNRFGPDGMTFPAKMNTNNGIIEIYDSKSSDGILAQKEAKNGEVAERKMLYKKYIDTVAQKTEGLG